MPVTNVKSRWVEGNLDFLDRSGDVIARWNGSDRTFDVALPGVLNIAGTPVNASASELSTLAYDPGRIAKGAVHFGAVADCTSVDVGSVVYLVDGTPTVEEGEWAVGASAAESATNLAAAINGDERNDGEPYFGAIAVDDVVHIYALESGVAGNGDVDRVGGAQPAITEALVGGSNAGIRQFTMIQRAVSAIEGTEDTMVIPLPFEPSAWTVTIYDATGLLREDITDLVTLEDTPDRIQITSDGAVHIAATDLVTVIAQE